MTSILFLIETIYCNIFRCNFFRNKKTFSKFFVAFWKTRFNFENFEKTDNLNSWGSFELIDSEEGGEINV